MSVAATRWALTQRDVGRAKLVLVVLADHAGDAGVCWPSLKLIAAECDIKTTETVGKHLRSLEDRGLIRRVGRQRVNGSCTSNYFVLAPGADDRGAMRAANAEDQYPASVAELTHPGEPPAEDLNDVQVAEPVHPGQMSLDGLGINHPPPDLSSTPPGFLGGPEPPVEPKTVCVDARAPEPATPVLSPSLDAVLVILAEAGDNANIEPAAVDTALRAFPAGEHLTAARYVLTQLLEPDCVCRAASILLFTALRRERQAPLVAPSGAPHEGRRRSAPPVPDPVSPAGRRWGPTGGKFDRAAGLV